MQLMRFAVAVLVSVAWLAAHPAAPARAASIAEVHGFEPVYELPAKVGAANIKTDFGAVGDGVTDDTEAFRKAIEADQPRTIYIPAGTYLVRDALVFGKNTSRKKRVFLVGHSASSSILRLADNAPGFADPANPKVFIQTLPPGQQGEQNMHQYLQHLTIEIGRGNPGAIGLSYHTNNSGCVKDVVIRAVDPASPGHIGLACRDWDVGPGSLRYITVDGFETGVSLTHVSNYVTLEHITVRNARVGVVSPTVSIRKLQTHDVDLPVRVTGQTVLIDSTLSGSGESAIQIERGGLLARAVKTSGFAASVSGEGLDQPHGSPDIDELVVGAVRQMPGDTSAPRTLNLPIEESPEIPYPRATEWTVVGGSGDISQALQAAIDAGAVDVLITDGAIHHTVYLRNKIRRLTAPGVRTVDLRTGDRPAIVVQDGDAPVVLIERIYGAYGSDTRISVQQETRRSVVIRHAGLTYASTPAAAGGKVFMESVVGAMRFEGGIHAWGRDLNTEAGGAGALNIDNIGSTVWILGQKTEDFATKIRTIGGSTELLGGTYRQNWDAEDLVRGGLDPADRPPLFEVDGGRMSATYISWGPNLPFDRLVRHRQGDTVTTLERSAAGGGATLFVTPQEP